MIAKWPKIVGEILNLPEDGSQVTETCRRIPYTPLGLSPIDRNMQEKTLISLRIVDKWPKHVGEILNLPEDGR